MSLRSELVAYLETVLEAFPGLDSIKLVPSVRDFGEITTPTLIVKTDRIAPIAAAPREKIGGFTLTLVSNHRDIDRAEDQLDDLLEALLPALLTAGILWTDATQVGYGDSNLAYDIRIQSVLKSEG